MRNKDRPTLSLSQTQLHKSAPFCFSAIYSVGLDSVILCDLRWIIRGISTRSSLNSGRQRERERERGEIVARARFLFIPFVIRPQVGAAGIFFFSAEWRRTREKGGKKIGESSLADKSVWGGWIKSIYLHLMGDREANIKTSLMSSRSGSIVRDAFHRSALSHSCSRCRPDSVTLAELRFGTHCSWTWTSRSQKLSECLLTIQSTK